LLAYATCADLKHEVEAVLKRLRETNSMSREEKNNYINARIPEIIEIGAPAHLTALFYAISWASSEIVTLLLDNGADPNVKDVGDRNVLMYGSFYGRIENVKVWFDRFPEWDISSRGSLNGNTALSLALGFGPYNRETIGFLIQKGASIHDVMDSGLSALMVSVWNEDTDIVMLRDLLKRLNEDVINYRARPRTVKWKLLRGTAKIMCRTGLSQSSLIRRLAHGDGMTALHYAARRGDMRAVEVLLNAGADPYIKTNMGRTSIDVCESFLEIRGVLEKRQRKYKLKNTKNRFLLGNLGKRLSTFDIYIYVMLNMILLSLSLSLSLSKS